MKQSVRWQIVGALKSGATVNEVVKQHNVSRRSVFRIKCKFIETGEVSDKPRSGRPRLTSPRTDRYLRRIADINRQMPAAVVRDTCPGVSAQKLSVRSVQKRLQDVGFRCTRAVRRQRLTPWHAKQRLLWCKANLAKFETSLEKYVFSDESNFMVRNRKNRILVRRKPNESIRQDVVQQGFASRMAARNSRSV